LQQKANTKAQKRNVFTDKLSQAYTNQADINQINAQDPSYYFDTRLNNTAFTGRPGNSPTSSTISTSSNLDNMSDEDLDKLYKKTRIQESQNRMQQRTQQGNRLGYINNQRRRR
jgi:ribosomal protein L29